MELYLYTTTTLLVELRCTFYWNSAKIRRTFPPLMFAGRVASDTKADFLRSIDTACYSQVRFSARYAGFGACPVLGYDAERYIIWDGFEKERLPISTVSEDEFQDQLDLMGRRGWKDRIQVAMAIEIDSPEDYPSDEDSEDGESEGGRDGGGGQNAASDSDVTITVVDESETLPSSSTTENAQP